MMAVNEHLKYPSVLCICKTATV